MSMPLVALFSGDQIGLVKMRSGWSSLFIRAEDDDSGDAFLVKQTLGHELAPEVDVGKDALRFG